MTNDHTRFLSNLARVRLAQDFLPLIRPKQDPAVIPVTRPNRHWYVRVHKNPDYHLRVWLQQDRLQGNFLVDNDRARATPGLAMAYTLVTAITRHGRLFLWPIEARHSSRRWIESAWEAVNMAMAEWVTIAVNAKTFCVTPAPEPVSDPEWPDLTPQRLLTIAFQDRTAP